MITAAERMVKEVAVSALSEQGEHMAGHGEACGSGGEGSTEGSRASRLVEEQATLLKTLSVGLHPMLLVEPLTTVAEVTKWYTAQVSVRVCVLVS